jgi:hypothetical protein
MPLLRSRMGARSAAAYLSKAQVFGGAAADRANQKKYHRVDRRTLRGEMVGDRKE